MYLPTFMRVSIDPCSFLALRVLMGICGNLPHVDCLICIVILCAIGLDIGECGTSGGNCEIRFVFMLIILALIVLLFIWWLALSLI